MKNILATLIILWIGVSGFAQSSTQLRPYWAYTVPTPPAGANYFLNWGVGEGSNEQEAVNAAWADALHKSFHELGVVGITQQDINDVYQCRCEVQPHEKAYRQCYRTDSTEW